jgi:hypothetical protein
MRQSALPGLPEVPHHGEQPVVAGRGYQVSPEPGIHLRRDSWLSVMYAEELNSGKSSVTLQRTDRHEIVGQKPPDFQVPL